MAMGEEADDEPPDIFYVCHPSKEVSTVICVICDAAYHKSDFARLDYTTFLSSSLVVCRNYKYTFLTSKPARADKERKGASGLSETARLIIAELKAKLKEAEQNCKAAVLNYSITEVGGNVCAASESASDAALKVENKLLNELNLELKDKNKVLKELLEEYRSRKSMSYSEAAKQQPASQLVSPPPLIVKPRDGKLKDFLVDVKTLVKSDVKVRVDKIIDKGKGGVIIKCKSASQTRAVNNASIMDRGRMYVGWQSCPVFDDFNINLCHKCRGFNHNKNKCKSKETCSKCAGHHATKDCKATTPVCPNCVAANSKYRTNRPKDHHAIDFRKCETYKRRVESAIRTIDYPTKPASCVWDTEARATHSGN